jgi:hypothetical protein
MNLHSINTSAPNGSKATSVPSNIGNQNMDCELKLSLVGLEGSQDGSRQRAPAMPFARISWLITLKYRLSVFGPREMGRNPHSAQYNAWSGVYVKAYTIPKRKINAMEALAPAMSVLPFLPSRFKKRNRVRDRKR